MALIGLLALAVAAVGAIAALAVAARTAATATRAPARLRGCGFASAFCRTRRLRTRMLRCALARLLRMLLTLRGTLARAKRGRLAARRHRSLRTACGPLALVLRACLGAPLSLSTLRTRTAAATTAGAAAIGRRGALGLGAVLLRCALLRCCGFLLLLGCGALTTVGALTLLHRRALRLGLGSRCLHRAGGSGGDAACAE